MEARLRRAQELSEELQEKLTKISQLIKVIQELCNDVYGDGESLVHRMPYAVEYITQ